MGYFKNKMNRELIIEKYGCGNAVIVFDNER